MILRQVLADAVAQLRQAGVPDPARDARRLLAHATGISQDRLTIELGEEVEARQFKTFFEFIERRSKREPVSHIVEYREFFGRRFFVSKDVLDPRPDTETLIEQALGTRFKTVLDIGTGSGCIILTLLAENEIAQGLGVDVSEPALEVARRNKDTLNIQSRAEFRRSDWFSDVNGCFDLIVSNPPYIDESEWETLDREPKEWEPKIALTPGADGLDPYRILTSQAGNYLNPLGQLLVEIGWQQGTAVKQLFINAGFSDVRVIHDIDGRDRVVTGFWRV